MQHVELILRFPPSMRDPLHAVAGFESVEDCTYLSSNVQPSANVAYKLFYVEGDPDAVRAELDAAPRIVEHIVTPVFDDSCYVLAGSDTGEMDDRWREAFSQFRVVFTGFRILDDERKRVSFIGEHFEPAELVAALPDEMDVAVEGVSTFDNPPSALNCALTERQYELVETAIAAGYYEVPREATLEAVAEAADCSHSTASRLLRRAEGAVMDRVVWG